MRRSADLPNSTARGIHLVIAEPALSLTACVAQAQTPWSLITPTLPIPVRLRKLSRFVSFRMASTPTRSSSIPPVTAPADSQFLDLMLEDSGHEQHEGTSR